MFYYVYSLICIQSSMLLDMYSLVYNYLNRLYIMFNQSITT